MVSIFFNQKKKNINHSLTHENSGTPSINRSEEETRIFSSHSNEDYKLYDAPKSGSWIETEIFNPPRKLVKPFGTRRIIDRCVGNSSKLNGSGRIGLNRYVN